MKLTDAQIRFMRRLAQLDGEDLVPGGFPEAGRVASNWYRTVRVLESRGLVRRATHHRVVLLLPAPAWVYAEAVRS